MSAARIAEVSRQLQVPVNAIHHALGIGEPAAQASSDPAMARFLATLDAVPADRDRVLRMLTTLLENMGALRATRGTTAK